MTTHDDAEHLKRFRELMSGFRTAMLTTACDDTLRARPMHVAKVDENGDLWFLSKKDTPKSEEIQKDHRVCVSFQSENKYLSLSGCGECITDKKTIDELWGSLGDHGSKAFEQLYFPKGKDDPNLSLLRVKSSNGEYWNYDTKELQEFIFKAGKEAQKGNLDHKFHQHMPIGENSKVNVSSH